jgi:hypothetical protein
MLGLDRDEGLACLLAWLGRRDEGLRLAWLGQRDEGLGLDKER